MQLFYGCFKHLASKSDVELRRACGAAFSEVLRAAAALHPAAFVQHFADTFTSLAGDLDEEVGCSQVGVACGHGVVWVWDSPGSS